MKTLEQQSTEAFLHMAEAVKVLEQQLAIANQRIAQLEAQRYSPWQNQQWPSYPPYTITCKMADGTTKDITMTSPIVAQNNG